MTVDALAEPACLLFARGNALNRNAGRGQGWAGWDSIDSIVMMLVMGWIISKKYRFIFIHIPKTGGTSIGEPMHGDGQRGALVPFLGPEDVVNAGHIRAVGLRERMGDEWGRYFKFAIVRNPWDRLVSSYHYFVQDEEKRGTELGMKIAECGGFHAFCRALDVLDLDPHFDPQLGYMIDYEGRFLLDWVGKFETLEKDLGAFCARFGIPLQAMPHYRRSSRGDYRNYYDEETQAIVAERYRGDINAFGYRF